MNIIQNGKKLFPYILLAVVVFLSYHQLLQMYFWRDDYTGLYVAQQGNLSTNPIFAYPYQWSLILNDWAWTLFGMNTTYYFLAMIIIYTLAAWLLFYFLRKLFSDKKIAFGCSLVFAAGYVGQDGMKMTMDGSNGLVALIFLLISLISLTLFRKENIKGSSIRKFYLFYISLISFFLTLEISPHRASSSLLILLVLDWVLSWDKKGFGLILRNILFIIIFLVQGLIHPSSLLLGYHIRPSVGYSSFILNFSPLYFLNFLGTFWNMIIPTSLQDQYNIYLGISTSKLTLIKFWMSGLPAISLMVILIIYLKILRPSVFTVISLVKKLTVLLILSFLWAKFILQINADKFDLVAVFNGGMWLIFLLSWIGWGVPKSKSLSLFSLFTVFGILGTFFLTIPDRVLASYNRYLLLPSFASSLLPIIFVTKEFYSGEVAKRKLAKSLVIMIVAILVLPRLFFAYQTQNEFLNNYSKHAKIIYQGLHFFLPKVDRPIIIYIEGADKALQLATGDAARVGFFGSEVAYAANFKTQKENFILPQSTTEIPALLNKNPQLSSEDIFTFIYDEKGLRNTSFITRKLLKGNDQPILVDREQWIKSGTRSLKFLPNSKIWTVFPVEVNISLKFLNVNRGDTMKINWEYNTSGLITENKFIDVTPSVDNLWHEYKWAIPAGGEYLKELFINFPEGSLTEIGRTELKYHIL